MDDDEEEEESESDDDSEGESGPDPEIAKARFDELTAAWKNTRTIIERPASFKQRSRRRFRVTCNCVYDVQIYTTFI